MINPQNLKIGACDIYFDSVFIGATKGGVTFKLDRKTTDLITDEDGETAVDVAITGQDVTVAFDMAEITMDNLKRAIPEGLYSASATDRKLGFGVKAGTLLGQFAKVLRLHPIGVTGLNDDIYITKAVSVGAIEIKYAPDGQRVIPFTFRGLVDTNEIDGRRLGTIGDTLIS